ncbi:hypothetical protein ASD11_13380 [Aeromicrobium sp. Root495]|uniref:bifunctional glycosyltransferase/CDP-glycerol:glycerophosphate glycerophosphotransferase n=1 Tax=Aeromicrobium sp. Root495 TaxID=1736550 RepID=UPI0006F3C6A7|nr:CDP-glycerol glycerophosphotransferase family protein [Aeromicrobium sp. Root495]KQY60435.1 hypothetical protein ASD11_13380 [Aeromicrobium sp. Root495]
MADRHDLVRRLRLALAAIAYKLRHPRRRPGYVSVVVPVYNVEAFVGECLRSLQKQVYKRLEIVVVDDGSPDRSVDVVQGFMAEDKRIKLVRRENGGLSAARNTGVKHARGQYIAFLDSDDTVQPTCYSDAVKSLRESGSDFAVFSYRRLRNRSIVQPGPWILEAHSRRLQGVTLDEFPDILVNAVAWSKVYDRTFFDRAGLTFPEGVLYEDQPVSAAAYMAARTFDVLPDQLVNWRERDDGQSISQQTRDLRDVRERFAAAVTSLKILSPNPLAHRTRVAQLLTNDLRHSIVKIPNSDPEFFEAVRVGVRDVVSQVEGVEWDAVGATMKIALGLIESATREQVIRFIHADGLGLQTYRTTVSDGEVLLDPTTIDVLPGQVERWRTVLAPSETPLDRWVRRAWWAPDGSLHLVGWALLQNLEDPDQTIRISVSGPGGAVVDLDVEQGYDDEILVLRQHKHCTYPGSYFEATLPADRVPVTPGSWVFEVSVEARGIVRSRRFREVQDVVTNRQLHLRTLPGGRQAGLALSDDLDLQLDVVAPQPTVASLSLEGGTLAVRYTDDVPVSAARLAGRGGPVLQRGADGSFTADVSRWAKVPLDPDPAQAVTARFPLQAETEGGRRRARGQVGEDIQVLGVVGPFAVCCVTTAKNEVTIDLRQRVVVLETFDASDAGIAVSGVAHGVGAAPQMLLRRRGLASTSPAATASDGAFEGFIDLAPGRWGLPGALPGGFYPLRVLTDAADGSPVEVIPRFRRAYLDQLPFDRDPGLVRLRLTHSRAKNPEVVLRSFTSHVDRSRARQAQLRAGVGLRDLPIREDTVLFRTFYGENTTCVARGIHRELVRRGADLDLCWAVKDLSVPVPEGGRPVVVNSSEWYELMHTAKYLVDNVHQPDWFRTRPEQVFVETFHGYPFKQMGLPYWRQHGYSEPRIESFLERASDWRYVVSPATYATPLLREAFGYDGEMLEVGYPRNDIFFSPEAPALRADVRRRLGIAPDAKVVLYGPTYRDWLSSTEFVSQMVDYLDYDAFLEGLGPDTVLLLRGHAMNARHKNRAARRPGLIDVTDYPEINDLVLASDAAIVDYSSLRFDLGVAGIPMVFLVPDLERYKGDRGALMDYEPTAPGPLVSTTQECIEALSDLDRLKAEHAEQVATFKRDFLDLDDGRSGERVVDVVFGDAVPPSPGDPTQG